MLTVNMHQAKSRLSELVRPITPEHCDAYGNLPNYDDHRDPFDRMLAVQARLDGCRLISGNPKLDRFGIRRI